MSKFVRHKIAVAGGRTPNHREEIKFCSVKGLANGYLCTSIVVLLFRPEDVVRYIASSLSKMTAFVSRLGFCLT